jgi:hypothetical protein
MSILKIKNLLPILFFALLLGFGLRCVPDFGTSIDEYVNYASGVVSEKFVLSRLAPKRYHRLMAQDSTFRTAQDLPSYCDNDYGVAFDLPVQFAIRGLGITDLRAQYIFKHQCNFFLFWLSACFFFAIVRLRNPSSALWAYLGTLLYVLHPRIFADAFYNPKDLPLLSFFVIGIYYQIRYLQTATWQRALAFALVTALAIDVRVLGIMLPATTALFTFLQIIQTNGLKISFWKHIPRVFGIYNIAVIAFVYAFFPMLWHKPLYFFEIFQHMSHFRWNGEVLYQGQVISSLAIPYSYLPNWIFISSPLGYTIAAIAGIMAIVWRILKSIRHNWHIFNTETEFLDTLFLVHCLVPICAIIAVHAVLYDGWRQIYFVYGGGALVALSGLSALANASASILFFIKTKIQGVSSNIDFKIKSQYFLSIFSLAVLVAHTAYLVYSHYPYTNVYFNSTVTDPPHQYEVDYWATGTADACAYIAAHDTSDSIQIDGTHHFVANMMHILPANTRKRLHHNPDKPNYYITQYRWAPYNMPPDNTYDAQEVYSIKIANMKITSVYKKKDYQPKFRN